jgi:transcriptional regulator with XRE-family HTH domain
MTPAQQLGVRLAAARHAAGLSQQQVADKLGVFQSTVAVMEKGRRDVSALELVQLAQLFGLSTDELLGVTARPCPPIRADALGVQGSGHAPRG